jgi:hypothetical protein
MRTLKNYCTHSRQGGLQMRWHYDLCVKYKDSFCMKRRGGIPQIFVNVFHECFLTTQKNYSNRFIRASEFFIFYYKLPYEHAYKLSTAFGLLMLAHDPSKLRVVSWILFHGYLLPRAEFQQTDPAGGFLWSFLRPVWTDTQADLKHVGSNLNDGYDILLIWKICMIIYHSHLSWFRIFTLLKIFSWKIPYVQGFKYPTFGSTGGDLPTQPRRLPPMFMYLTTIFQL